MSLTQLAHIDQFGTIGKQEFHAFAQLLDYVFMGHAYPRHVSTQCGVCLELL
jgi:hypothetical protein